MSMRREGKYWAGYFGECTALTHTPYIPPGGITPECRDGDDLGQGGLSNQCSEQCSECLFSSGDQKRERSPRKT